MNKFKKGLIMALAVGVLMIGSVFGEDTSTSKQFTITTKVPAVNELKISTTEITTNVGFSGLKTVSSYDFGDLANGADSPLSVSTTHYLVVKTNFKTASTIKADFGAMVGSGTNKLNYTLASGSFTQKTGTSAITDFKIADIAAANGVRVVSKPFTITIDGDDILGAVPDNYTGIITFNFITK